MLVVWVDVGALDVPVVAVVLAAVVAELRTVDAAAVGKRDCWDPESPWEWRKKALLLLL